MDAFVDTSVIIPAILESSDSDLVQNFIHSTQYRLVISPLIYHEALFARTKILLRERFGLESIAAVRNYIRKNGYLDISDYLECLNLLVRDFFVCMDSTNAFLISDIACRYRLLSGDAMIIATCMEHNINHLASFDTDFRTIEGFHLILEQDKTGC